MVLQYPTDCKPSNHTSTLPQNETRVAEVLQQHLKTTTGWTGENGDDFLGFSALPGGRCDEEQTCRNIGATGYWWTSTEKAKNSNHYTLFLTGDTDSFSASTTMDNDQYISVRCVKK